MDYLQIKGAKNLEGKIAISGAKNAALPIIAMTILAKNRVKIQNTPQVADIKTLIKLLQNLGATAKFKDSTLQIETLNINSTKATYDIVRTMRASILVLGPLLARFGHCEVSLPGGCAIGARPIDLHLSALEKMGAKIEIKDGYVIASANDGLKGANIVFDKITVTGTENIVMAASLANGITKIFNAAKEPEVVQLCEILNQNGVKIEGIGTSELVIYGTNRSLINIDEITVIPDRIEAGTYMCAVAIAGGKVVLENINPDHLVAITSKLSDMGVKFEFGSNFIKVISDGNLKPCNIITTEFPGFPTDMQAQFMALACVADGVSSIDERLFENRFMHASELSRMGADIKLNAHIATITGGKLNGADVMATDLRASSALIIAALRAQGITRIHRIYHLDRGYENLESKLTAIGADIKRLSE
ncbi:UDP-N-acetylglucosamine 1-carboxyvinyltransferase [Campylobacter sp.]|uniref:UDP-N-acetylglucosamine 1-carboxyvinyltransferase n=1 Tax=Campylobacter sp. TaxID=205 RepID=UPI00259CA7C8|nr:UDP-N-acetylglucosamine 1-carboxyvinyltransferase [Campylobacter sp.]MBQ7135365.1 UDP-N-acetylglucosamine 1-carboxyvinyltransferase [Campylobacter sp.]